jgi:polyferredoxin
MMKKSFAIILVLCLSSITAFAQRFPKPDFESGYQYPNLVYGAPNEMLLTALDLVMLVALMGIVAWAVIRRKTRKPVIWVSVLSVAYFGFYRSGCVCSIGSIQNVTLAFADATYVMPMSVLLFFILPVLFSLLFGRVFCAGVCPFGALQELVNMRNVTLPRALTTALGIIPWTYLILAVLYAATRSSFIICRFDPFIGIFRLGGDLGLILFGSLLLLVAVFTGRPFCRFLCPYGALLSLFSRVSIWRMKITPACINCELCHHACPVDAIRPPYNNKVKESRMLGVKRILMYVVFLPLMMGVGGFLLRMMSDTLSHGNKDVRLYEMVMQYEQQQGTLPIDVETFYGQGGRLEELSHHVIGIQSDFHLYTTIAGGLIGMVIGLTLIRLSVKRSRKTYEIDDAACVNCGRCFNYCPQYQSIKSGMNNS